MTLWNINELQVLPVHLRIDWQRWYYLRLAFWQLLKDRVTVRAPVGELLLVRPAIDVKSKSFIEACNLTYCVTNIL